MRLVRGFVRFWYDFLVGDDWKIAVAVVQILALGAVATIVFEPPEKALTASLGLALMVAFVLVLRIDVRRRR